MTSIAQPQSATQGGLRGWATKQDWIVQKARIERFYLTKTLPEVMSIMELQYGFRAT